MLQVGLRYSYPSDLSDQQWNLIREFIPETRAGGRPRKTCMRRTVDAIFYLIRTGCAWRYLPPDFPPWQTVYGYFREWKTTGLWERVHRHLVGEAREAVGRAREPSELVVDSQSVKADRGEALGYDGFKKVRGRKHTYLVDTLGFVHGISVHSADTSDGIAAMDLIRTDTKWGLEDGARPIKAIYADGGYRGRFEAEAIVRLGICPTYRRSLLKKDAKNARSVLESNLIPKRWVVERTFGWKNNYRRLSRDYERCLESSRTMAFLAMSQLLLRRLTRPAETYRRW